MKSLSRTIRLLLTLALLVTGVVGAFPRPAFAVEANDIIINVAGDGTSGYSGDGGPATAAQITQAAGIAVGTGGVIFIADPLSDVIRKVDGLGVITTVAGDGTTGYSGDGGPATAAQLSGPVGLALDAMTGDLYIADFDNKVVRKVDNAGIITTVAGNGTEGYSGDGGPATAAQLGYPVSLALDGLGNLYIADVGNNVVRKVDSAGTISTMAGDGTAGYSGDGGPATAAQLTQPMGLAADRLGNIYIADLGNIVVRKVSSAGTISTVAGNGTFGYSGDGGPATAAQLALTNESGGGAVLSLALDSAGNLYIPDFLNNVVRKVDPAGTISTVVGDGSFSYGGDGGPARAAQVVVPWAVAVDSADTLYLTELFVPVVRSVGSIDLPTVITTVAGDGTGGYSGDGGPALAAQLALPSGITLDAAGNLYIADLGVNVVRKVDSAGVITTVAGDGTYGYSGDGGPATAAQLDSPAALAVDVAGNLYIADSNNNVVRKVDNAGIITTVAGNGTQGYSGDGGLATAAQLDTPVGLALDGLGNLYIADDNSVVRKVDSAGTISTVAGTGTAGYSGDGGPATAAELNQPMGLAADRLGNIYIADLANNVVRKVNSAGTISTVAGNGTGGYSGDGGPATAAQLGFLNENGFGLALSLALDPAGNLYIPDFLNNVVRKVTPAGTISTVVGDGSYSYGGDGGPPLAAQVLLPFAVATDAVGNLYLTEAFVPVVRRVGPQASQPLVAVNDTYSTFVDQALAIPLSNMMGNDSMPADHSVVLGGLTNVSAGQISLSDALYYTPPAGWSGTASFQYRLKDQTTGAFSNWATVTINVDLPPNTAPVAAADSYTSAEDAVLSVDSAQGVLANDSDAEGDPLTATVVNQPDHGSLSFNADGSFTYTPNANYNGSDSFSYQVSDGELSSNVATVSLSISAVNDTPVALNDSYATDEDTPLSVDAASGVLANDTDGDGDTLSATVVSGPAHGTLTLSANGSFSYTPAANFNGEDSFTYQASDGTASSATRTVTLVVGGVNDAPVAVDNSYSTSEDTALTVAAPGVLGNDSDVDGDPLTVAMVEQPAHGSLSLNPNGSFTYTPNANYNGADSFSYQAKDGQLNSEVATVSLTVIAVNDAPVAVGESYTTNEDTLLSVAAPGVLANDSDPVEGSPLTAVLVTGPAHGTLTLNANGSFSYTPAANYSGADSFSYRASDGTDGSNIVTVSITVISAQGLIDELRADVQTLVSSGALNSGNGTALLARLAQTTSHLDKGKTAQAIGAMEGFVKQVDTFVGSGKLTAEAGQELIDAANAIIHSLSV